MEAACQPKVPSGRLLPSIAIQRLPWEESMSELTCDNISERVVNSAEIAQLY